MSISVEKPQETGLTITDLPAPCVQNHAANLMPLPNGDLACVWFGGTQEGIADISVWFTRRPAGCRDWTTPVQLSDDPTRSEQNPILFPAPDGRLWLFYTAQKSGNQDTAIVRYRISEDMGVTWGPIQALFDRPGIFVRQPLVVLDNGDWLLPVFHCQVRPGEKWVGDHDTSAVCISSDHGKTWTEHVVPESTGCVHMCIEKLDDGSLVALYRSRWADNIYLSRSQDGGHTWSAPQPTELPNNNSSIQVTRLANGHLALVFNNICASAATERRASLYDEIEDDKPTAAAGPVALHQQPARTAFWGTPRAPMTLAISEDGGRTWLWLRDIETGDGYCMSNNSREQRNRELSYPSIKQGASGRIYIAYTHFRQAIRFVELDENWVRQTN